MNVTVSFTPTIPGGSVTANNAASFSAAKTAIQTEIQNRLNANQADATKLQDALTQVNS